MSNDPSRRQFLQGMAAGFAVAAMPAGIAIAERTAAATEILKAPGWSFTIMGGSGGMGDSLILRPPGSYLSLAQMDLAHLLCWPEPLDVGALQDGGDMVRLIPWRPYRKQFEKLIPGDVWADYQRARKWSPR